MGQDRDLPDYLSRYKDGRFVYTRPTDGQRFSFGTDQVRAVRLAKRANEQLMPKAHEAEAAILGRALGLDTAATLATVIERFRGEYIPEQRYSPKTLAEYERMLGVIDNKLGENTAGRLTVHQAAHFLDAYPPRMSNRYRSLLAMLYKFAIAKGYAETNPAQATLKRKVKVQRQRLKLETFNAIRKAADPWFANALDLALHTLQRREDIAVMRFDNQHDGRFFIEQIKVERHGTGKIAMRATPELQAIIRRCRDDLVSPFLIHRKPKRKRREYLDQKDHWTQVTPEMLTREFHRLRDELHLCDDLTPKQRPSFHEIRGLGAKLYEEAGVPRAEVQKLLGHTTEKQTQVYLDRHEVQWTEVDAGLSI